MGVEQGSHGSIAGRAAGRMALDLFGAALRTVFLRALLLEAARRPPFFVRPPAARFALLAFFFFFMASLCSGPLSSCGDLALRPRESACSDGRHPDARPPFVEKAPRWAPPQVH